MTITNTKGQPWYNTEEEVLGLPRKERDHMLKELEELASVYQQELGKYI